jgi:hypothetical protein
MIQPSHRTPPWDETLDRGRHCHEHAQEHHRRRHVTDKVAYAPTRFEEAVEANKSTLHQIDDGNALEFACQANAQAMTINMLATVATGR